MAREADAEAIVVGTPRLDLRPLVMEDLDDLARLFADEKSMRNQCRLGDRSDAAAYIEQSMECFRQNGFGQLTVIARATGAFVGKCGFTAHEVDGHREFILSHLIDPVYEADDYDREAFLAMVEHAFDDLDFMRVVSLVKPGNRRIVRIVEAAGMEAETELMWDGARFRMYVKHSF